MEIKKTLPSLVKMSSTYKLEVPENVEEKIRYLLRKFPSTEWSGVLFYTHEGSFEDNNLVITCQDIYPMDLGNATYTDFFMSEEVTSYMSQNIDTLWECDLGLIHSHHTMSTFFSGTDTSTLQSEGNERNCFVSLIVNNAGTYSAAITRKMQEKKEVCVKSLGTSYEFFGDGPVTTEEANMSEKTEIVDSEVIQYFMLDVNRHETINSLDYLDKRFEEISSRKKSESTHKYDLLSYYPYSYDHDSLKSYYSNDWYKKPEDKKKREITLNEPVKELPLWNDETMEELEAEPAFKPDPEIVKDTAIRLVTSNLIISTEKFDMKQWVKRHMVKVYDNIFNGFDGYTDFDTWCDSIVEFFVIGFPTADKDAVIYEDEWYSAVAQAIETEIVPYADDNPYIQKYCEALERYIV